VSTKEENKRIPTFHLQHFSNPSLSETVTKDFCNQMNKKGFAVIRLPSECTEVINKMWKISTNFFDSPHELKEACKILSWRDVGYLKTEGVKEFWQMRMSDVSDFPWPSFPEFKECMLEGFQLLDQVGRICLGLLAQGIKINPGRLIEALDHEPLGSGNFSNSILSIYRYFKHELVKESCDIHKDMGILTLVPCAAVPGLEVLDYENICWVEVEKIADTATDVIVFNSECLERMTAGYYSGCIHRVV